MHISIYKFWRDIWDMRFLPIDDYFEILLFTSDSIIEQGQISQHFQNLNLNFHGCTQVAFRTLLLTDINWNKDISK